MTDQKTAEARRKFVAAFYDTMLQIWKERVILTGAIRTGSLYRSIRTGYMTHNGEVTAVAMGFRFNDYGFYVDRGTGRGIARGNSGDLGRQVTRKPKPWLIRKFRASEYNLRDFFLESLSIQFIHIIDDTLAGSTRIGSAIIPGRRPSNP